MEADSSYVHSPPEICVFFTQNNLHHLSFAFDNFHFHPNNELQILLLESPCSSVRPSIRRPEIWVTWPERPKGTKDKVNMPEGQKPGPKSRQLVINKAWIDRLGNEKPFCIQCMKQRVLCSHSGGRFLVFKIPWKKIHCRFFPFEIFS